MTLEEAIRARHSVRQYTEKPIEAAEASPPISHPVVSTMPMAADALAPRCPTIDASMKNITVADICARIEGILRLTISLSFSLCVISRPSRIYANKSTFSLLCPNITDMECKDTK